MKIKGFNSKEQICYSILKDGKAHSIAEMKKSFMSEARERCREVYEKGWGDDEADAMAQSFVRNSVRRLIRDGWAEKKAYGTYELTTQGKKWVKAGKDTTASFGTKRGRKPMTEEQKEEARKRREKEGKTSKKVKTAPKEKKEKEPKKAKEPKAAKKVAEKKITKKVEAKKAEPKKADAKKGNGVAQKKASEIKKRMAKQVAKDKAEEIKDKVMDQEPEAAAE